MSVRVKICGVTRPEDAAAAAAAGASAIGLVFWPESPRAVTLEQAARCAAAAGHASVVGVFVDQAPALVRAAVERVPLAGVQLHGDENVDQYRFGAHVIKAIAVGPDWRPSSVRDVPTDVLPLLDPRLMGGTGRRVNWRLAGEAARLRPLMLAGGIHERNVAVAIDRVAPYALDVSSGVELEPGIKDVNRIERLLAAVERVAGPVPGALW